MNRVLVAAALLLAAPAFAQETASRDHTVTVTSTVPVIAGQKSTLYVRERALPEVLRNGAGDKVVLFIHGAGTPAEVSFDVPYQDYSWMGYLAKAGYDVFSVDMTGYGRSARPRGMNDKCNLSPEQQKSSASIVRRPIPAISPISNPTGTTFRAAVAFIQNLRHVRKISLVGWSQGGPVPAAGLPIIPIRWPSSFCWRRPIIAPTKSERPPLPVPGAVFNTQSHDEFIANWDRQAPCPGQYDKRAAASVWSEMLKSDPVGATWKPAVRRAPIASSGWGWTTDKVKAMTTPVLMVSGVNDKQVNPDRVRELHADLGSRQQDFHRPGLLLPQRHVGEEPSAAVQGLAGMAGKRHGQRPVVRHAEDGLLAFQWRR